MNYNQRNLPSKTVAGILGMFLGALGIHRFYMGENGVGVAYLLCTILLSWTIVVPVIIACVAFLEGISYFF